MRRKNHFKLEPPPAAVVSTSLTVAFSQWARVGREISAPFLPASTSLWGSRLARLADEMPEEFSAFTALPRVGRGR